MKKLFVMFAVIMVVVFSATGCTSTISHETHTSELRMENLQTGHVEWINLD